MEQTSMTALVSAFSRAYHVRNNDVKIFDDSVAGQLLSDEEYGQIAKSMADGIAFFNPGFAGGPEEALRWVVDQQLSPSPLGRAAFAEKSLERAVLIGARQYLILGAGYDTFAYRQPPWAQGLEIFEIDHPATAGDKRRRLENAGLVIPQNVHFVEADFTKTGWEEPLLREQTFDRNQISFCAILGVSYYLPKENFEAMIAVLRELVSSGSAILLDYPDEDSYTQRAGERAKKQALLAGGANEKMVARYAYRDMERLLSNHGFLIHEHLTPREMTEQYFASYNQANPSHPMTAFDNVNYCLAIKS